MHRRFIGFVAILVPYLFFIVGIAILGAAFTVPNIVFTAIGQTGLLITVLAVAGSLIVILRTDTILVQINKQVNEEYPSDRK